MLEQPRYSPLVARPVWNDGDTQPRDAADSAPLVDFGFVLKVVRRRLKLILLFTALALAVGAIVYASATPMYSATARLIIEKRTVDALQQESVLANTNLNPAEIDGQLQVISSDDLIARAILSAGLLDDPEFVEAPKSILQRATDDFVDLIVQNSFVRENFPWALEPEPVRSTTKLQAAVNDVDRNLRVDSVGISYVMTVDVAWTSPSMAARIANAISETYVAHRLSQRTNEAAAASTWFDGQLKQLSKKADDAEAIVATFRAENNIIDAGREGLLSEQQLSDLNGELAKAVQTSQGARDQLSRVENISADDIAHAPIGNSSEEGALNKLRDEYFALQAKVEEAAATYGDDHEITIELRDQLSRLSARITAETARLKAAFQSAYDLASANEAQLRLQMQELTGQSRVVSSAQVKLKALESEAAVYRSLYDSYLQRFLQTAQQQSFPSSDARIISAAVAPEGRDSPRGREILAISLAIGASLGLGAAFVRERMDRSIRTPWQLRLITGAPTLGLLPRMAKRPVNPAHRAVMRSDLSKADVPTLNQLHIADRRYSIAMLEPTSRFTETIRRIKVATDAVGQNKPCCLVGFISSESSEWRSIVATNYAQLVASTGRKCLLIDLDLREFTLTRALTPQTSSGLVDLSAPGATVHAASAIWRDEVSRLDFLPARDITNNDEIANGLLSSERLLRMLKQLAGSYETIVLDLQPLSVSSDAVALANMISGFILVSEWGKTSGDALADHLSQSGIPGDMLLGTVIGDVDMAKYRKYERVD
jgi:polysaccharide biosynthesis transport protein